MVKGDAVQLSFVMCPYTEEDIDKIVLVPDLGNFCSLSALPSCAYVLKLHAPGPAQSTTTNMLR